MQKSIFCALLLSSFLNSIAAVNRGYWDPEASTVAKFQSEETFADYSLRMLGASQASQFQANDQQGANWYWGSRINESGELIDATRSNRTAGRDSWQQSTGVWIESNNRAWFPRSYFDETTKWAYYNYYAATAESNATVGIAPDSICPSGWGLPVQPEEGVNKSWYNLLVDSYGLQSDAQSSAQARQSALSLSYNGNYSGLYGYVNYPNMGRYASSNMNVETTGNTGLLQISEDTLIPDGRNQAINGYSVRCVKK